MSDFQRSFEGIWIPKEEWLDRELSLVEKVMLVEIRSLSGGPRGCYASNSYFAEFFGLSRSRVSEIISSLESKGRIKVSLLREGKQIVERQIRTVKVFGNTNTPSEKASTLFGKGDEPYSEKAKENNTKSSSTDDTEVTNPECPVKDIVALYNEILAHQLPEVVLVNAGRRKSVTARWNEHKRCQKMSFWVEYFEQVERSDFLMGKTQSRPGQKPFEATFDWLMCPSNFVKVIEGNYDNKTESTR